MVAKSTIIRRVSALMLAFVLVFALAGVASAIDITVTTTWNYITLSPTNQLSYFLAPSNSVTLSIAGADASTTYPMTYAQASAITWSLPYGGSGQISITSNTVTNASITVCGDTYHGYFANTTVSVSSTATEGIPYVVRATYSGTGATFDYAVTVQHATAQSPATVTAYVVDAETADIIVNGASVTVAAPNDTNYPNYNYQTYAYGLLSGQSWALQNDPSALGVLDSLRKTTLTTVELYAGGLAVSINGITPLDVYAAWRYAVYDGSGNLVPITQSMNFDLDLLAYQAMGAAAFPLTGTSGYTVVWKYTDNFYFESTLSDEMATW